MFNIGPLELMVILLLALVVVGPSRLPEVGRSIGKGLRELRKVQDEVRDSINFDLDAEPKPPRPAPRPRTPRSTPTADEPETPATPIEPETPAAGEVAPGVLGERDVSVDEPPTHGEPTAQDVTPAEDEPSTRSPNGSTPPPESPPPSLPE